jgi:hypothetical protein
MPKFHFEYVLFNFIDIQSEIVQKKILIKMLILNESNKALPDHDRTVSIIFF